MRRGGPGIGKARWAKVRAGMVWRAEAGRGETRAVNSGKRILCVYRSG